MTQEKLPHRKELCLQSERISPLGLILFCVYDEPSTDLCLHKNLYLANVHHRAFKRDGVQSIQIE